MPQMAPLSWLTLMIMSIIILLLFMVLNFSFSFPSLSTKKMTKKSTSINWKW